MIAAVLLDWMLDLPEVVASGSVLPLCAEHIGFLKDTVTIGSVWCHVVPSKTRVKDLNLAFADGLLSFFASMLFGIELALVN